MSDARTEIRDPAHWRKLATEMRALAAHTLDPQAKEIILRLAIDYDKLAARAADRAREGI